MVPKGDIDLRIGGKMRTTYDPNATLGDESTIVNTILSFDPERMLSIKATTPPKNFQFKLALKSTWSVMYLDELSPTQTRLRIVGLGYGDDEESQKMRDFFLAGNAWTINKLKEKFASPHSKDQSDESATKNGADEDQSRDDTVWKLVSRLAGGDWIHESKGEDGSIFRVRNHIEMGPSSQTLVGWSQLGSTEGMYLHGSSQVWREPGTGHVLFQNLNELSGIATGRITLHDDKTAIWDWHIHTRSDKRVQFQVNMIFEGTNAYRMQLYRMDRNGKFQQLNNLEFQRVSEVPPQYLKMRADKEASENPK